jgi:hypothetical protein
LPGLGAVIEVRISKSDSFQHNFGLAHFRDRGYTPAMSEQLESAFPVGAFQPLISGRPDDGVVRYPGLSMAKPAKKHSIVAAVFLMLYIAIYLAIGFLGISLIGRAWATVFE